MIELPGLLLSPEFRVYGPDGAQLCATSFPYPATVSCALPGTGSYAILADSSTEDETGGYYLYLQRLNNPGNSSPITFGQILSASIDSLAEMDAYTFAANAGDKVLVRMGGLSNFPLHIWPEIEVYGPDGSQVCGASRGNDVAETPTCSLTGTGTYTILALDHPGTGTSAYALYLQRLDHPAHSVPIAFGQTRSGTIVSFADMHTYTFAAKAGDRVLVRMSWISGVFEPEVRVNGPDGTQLCKALGVYAAEIASCTLTTTGNYAILAADAYDVYTSGIFTGHYTLYLQRFSQSALPSIPAQDGWVLESGESTNLGGVPNSTATTFRLGDDASRKQYRTVLSFNTGALPDNAIITGVTLKLRRQSITGGGDPFSMFQGLFIDMRKGFFGAAE